MRMIVKSIKLPKELIAKWKKKYNKSGDKRIRELMIKDLEG